MLSDIKHGMVEKHLFYFMLIAQFRLSICNNMKKVIGRRQIPCTSWSDVLDVASFLLKLAATQKYNSPFIPTIE